MENTPDSLHDVVILGGGLVGITLAIALDAHGLTSAVIDPASPATTLAPGFDGRASAVASAAWRMLGAIGVAARLEGQGCPIAAIRVTDGLAPGGLVFDPAPEDGAVGIMFENRRLRRALREAAEAAPNVTLFTPATPAQVTRDADGVRVMLEDGRTVAGALLVAAEGRNSPTRAAAGINVATWQYDHAAIIASVRHEHPHDGIAHEIFYPAGPFAILPLVDDAEGRHRSAIVWTVAGKDAEGMLALGDRGFAAEAEKKMGGLLGAITLASPRTTYPLGFHHAARITGERLALVGDAAHGIHPIAGQGLNLGFRDVAALVEVLVEAKRLGLDPGDAQGLARYERWRALDTFMVAAATDSLNRLFGLRGRTAAAARRFGLGAVQRLSPLKDRFMAEARGETGTLPKLLQGIAV
ncbi:UbiH/UbiF/VisC/COQ6 family ubiquinone biosynthesis hydroxylase [Sphingomonas solaris]|uniref:Ubiquinone biosynthesis protein UbiH n=1 Tax=Alterirhizorhabdus solaris TaxID=2529389 RepID=A0A558R662_9SPHN|nr:UbiH/UbiF/VisC/COQ6 family ubiquinone biosynthesis hydroxylase [Sphingomonas solaris]TVV74875.1 ubiquinone biosynthesis protein UbiH [Sphingomonas solaris]